MDSKYALPSNITRVNFNILLNNADIVMGSKTWSQSKPLILCVAYPVHLTSSQIEEKKHEEFNKNLCSFA